MALSNLVLLMGFENEDWMYEALSHPPPFLVNLFWCKKFIEKSY